LGVNLACLWLFIRPPDLSGWCLDTPSFSNHGRVNNLLKRHT
jgi:hypothetical protein